MKGGDGWEGRVCVWGGIKGEGEEEEGRGPLTHAYAYALHVPKPLYL